MSDRDRVKTIVSYLYEARLAGCMVVVPPLPDVWDRWYLCYRLWRSAGALGVADSPAGSLCTECLDLVLRLTASSPPAYPCTPPSCGCFLRWAAKTRRLDPASPEVDSPGMVLSFALLKPGAPAEPIRRMLQARYRIVDQREVRLTSTGMNRLYPDAYGEDFLARQSRYLGSGPVEALLLRSSSGEPECAPAIRARVRVGLGVTTAFENHLHMPDSPGETLANIEQFFGSRALHEHYRRTELAHGQRRLALYRTLLGA